MFQKYGHEAVFTGQPTRAAKPPFKPPGTAEDLSGWFCEVKFCTWFPPGLPCVGIKYVHKEAGDHVVACSLDLPVSHKFHYKLVEESGYTTRYATEVLNIKNQLDSRSCTELSTELERRGAPHRVDEPKHELIDRLAHLKAEENVADDGGRRWKLHDDDKGKPAGQTRVRPASVPSPRRARVSDARLFPRCGGSASVWVVDPSCHVDYGNLCNGVSFKLCDDCR